MPAPRTLLYALLFISIVGLCFADPIHQPQTYHVYADARTILGIPYFWNVVSNLPMFFIGAYGLWQAFQNWTERPSGVARWIPLVLSTGIFVTCFGSGYYHWIPKNGTLVWDRLPMTLMFMPLFSLIIYDYIGKRAATTTFFIALPAGIASVLYWQVTEAAGHGDLRPYALVQFFPMLVIIVFLLAYPAKVPYSKPLLLVLAWYVLAKVCEHYDHEIYQFSGFWSGHTLKHLCASVALVYVIQVVELSGSTSVVMRKDYD